jgi:hypothetical protein
MEPPLLPPGCANCQAQPSRFDRSPLVGADRGVSIIKFRGDEHYLNMSIQVAFREKLMRPVLGVAVAPEGSRYISIDKGITLSPIQK